MSASAPPRLGRCRCLLLAALVVALLWSRAQVVAGSCDDDINVFVEYLEYLYRSQAATNSGKSRWSLDLCKTEFRKANGKLEGTCPSDAPEGCVLLSLGQRNVTCLRSPDLTYRPKSAAVPD